MCSNNMLGYSGHLFALIQNRNLSLLAYWEYQIVQHTPHLMPPYIHTLIVILFRLILIFVIGSSHLISCGIVVKLKGTLKIGLYPLWIPFCQPNFSLSFSLFPSLCVSHCMYHFFWIVCGWVAMCTLKRFDLIWWRSYNVPMFCFPSVCISLLGTFACSQPDIGMCFPSSSTCQHCPVISSIWRSLNVNVNAFHIIFKFWAFISWRRQFFSLRYPDIKIDGVF